MKVGPISAENGFPVWYKDENGLRLQLNPDPSDPYSIIEPVDLPNPTQPVSFPDNFPSEAFYQLAEAEMTTGTGERARLVLGLEAAFVNEIPRDGEQIVFGRVRIRVSGLRPNTEYVIRHPYGVDTIIAEPDPGEPGFGEINFTEDIGGLNGGEFHLALNSRIHPFLQWDPQVSPLAPEGYIGDPNIEHPIIGSVILDQFNQPQNYFRIEGPGIGIGSPDRSTTPGLNPDNCIETKNFTLSGKISTISGVDVTRMTYARSSSAGGEIDVFATSDDTPQEIIVDGLNVTPSAMRGVNGVYFSRVGFTGETVPSQVMVTNVSDNPDSIKIVTPVDFITATANYQTDSNTLTITAESGDTWIRPLLTVKDFGVGNLTIPVEGKLIMNDLIFSPANVTILSTAGGSTTVPVTIIGPSNEPLPVVASAGENQTILIGKQVILDGSRSTGPITSFQWSQVSGPVVELVDADTPSPSFIAPQTPSVLEFMLTVAGESSTSTSNVTITVLETAPEPLADAGPDQSVQQGAVVTLQGAGSEGATFLWEQVSGVPVQLNNFETATADFIFPKKNDTLIFKLTVTSAGGTASDTTQISTGPDNLTVTRAELRTQSAEWRIQGTSDVSGPGVTITIYIGNTANGTILGQAEVDTLGGWQYRVQGVNVQPDSTRAITIVSSSGGSIVGVPLTIRR